MKAFAYSRHGDGSVLKAHELDTPKLGKSQALIRVHSMALNPLDYRLRSGAFKVVTGFRFPRLIGSDFSGTIEAVGHDVAGFDIDDAVIGMTQQVFRGVSADLIAINVDQITHAPRSLDLTHAASLPLAALTAYQALTDLVTITPGMKVLINGASGGVGVFATQMAAVFGAQVTAVTSYRNTGWMESLGASESLDYTKTDFTKASARYDVIFDCYGNRPFLRSKPALVDNGTYISTIPAPHTYASTLLNAFRSQKSKVVVVRPRGSDLKTIVDMIDGGRLKTIVDEIFQREDIYAAYGKLESKRAKGKIVVELNPA